MAVLCQARDLCSRENSYQTAERAVRGLLLSDILISTALALLMIADTEEYSIRTRSLLPCLSSCQGSFGLIETVNVELRCSHLHEGGCYFTHTASIRRSEQLCEQTFDRPRGCYILEQYSTLHETLSAVCSRDHRTQTDLAVLPVHSVHACFSSELCHPSGTLFPAIQDADASVEQSPGFFAATFLSC